MIEVKPQSPQLTEGGMIEVRPQSFHYAKQKAPLTQNFSLFLT